MSNIQRYTINEFSHKHPDKDGKWCLHIDADAALVEQSKDIYELQKAVNFLLSLITDDLTDSETKYINKIEAML